MKVLALDHFSIGTAKLEETRAFWCDVLGFTVGPRPRLASTGYWLYSGGKALIHLVEQKGKPVGAADPADVVETGTDDHIALAVEDASSVVAHMKEKGVPYWDRLLADRNLYQVFVRDPNGVVVELNDASPDLSRLSPMAVQGR